MKFILILCLQMYEKKMRKPNCYAMIYRIIKRVTIFHLVLILS